MSYKILNYRDRRYRLVKTDVSEWDNNHSWLVIGEIQCLKDLWAFRNVRPRKWKAGAGFGSDYSVWDKYPDPDSINGYFFKMVAYC